MGRVGCPRSNVQGSRGAWAPFAMAPNVGFSSWGGRARRPRSRTRQAISPPGGMPSAATAMDPAKSRSRRVPGGTIFVPLAGAFVPGARRFVPSPPGFVPSRYPVEHPIGGCNGLPWRRLGGNFEPHLNDLRLAISSGGHVARRAWSNDAGWKPAVRSVRGPISVSASTMSPSFRRGAPRQVAEVVTVSDMSSDWPPPAATATRIPDYEIWHTSTSDYILRKPSTTWLVCCIPSRCPPHARGRVGRPEPT
jgi:hypothetical protein